MAAPVPTSPPVVARVVAQTVKAPPKKIRAGNEVKWAKWAKWTEQGSKVARKTHTKKKCLVKKPKGQRRRGERIDQYRDTKIDTSPPVVTCQAASFDVGQSGEVTASVSDAGSGPAATSVSSAATTDTTGSFTATLSATDIAGNSTKTACAYTVTEATEPGTTPPAGLKKQKPTNSAAKPPKRIKTSGLTVIAGKIHAPTPNNASAPVLVVGRSARRPPAKCATSRSSVARRARFRFAPTGYPGLRIVVRQTTPSTTGYMRYKRTSVYLDGRGRGA